MSYSVSVIIPAYKEEEFIEDAIKKLQNKLEENKFVYEIIIILDKASYDKTEEIVKKLIKENNKIRLITRANKLGVGSAVKDGIRNSKNETILITTAEISEDPDDLIKLLNKINEGYDLVSGNRFFQGSKIEGYSKKQFIANRLCNFAIRILFGIKLNDITNGVKAYKSSIIKNIELSAKSFDIFAEIPIKILKNKGITFYELPVKHKVRNQKFSKFNFSKEASLFFKILLKCL
jgi:glycosyltransferase involved in cell wall biosynthesis